MVIFLSALAELLCAGGVVCGGGVVCAIATVAHPRIAEHATIHALFIILPPARSPATMVPQSCCSLDRIAHRQLSSTRRALQRKRQHYGCAYRRTAQSGIPTDRCVRYGASGTTKSIRRQCAVDASQSFGSIHGYAIAQRRQQISVSLCVLCVLCVRCV